MNEGLFIDCTTGAAERRELTEAEAAGYDAHNQELSDVGAPGADRVELIEQLRRRAAKNPDLALLAKLLGLDIS